jgi:hypothetical protein
MRMMIATLLSSALFATLAAQDSEKKVKMRDVPPGSSAGDQGAKPQGNVARRRDRFQ